MDPADYDLTDENCKEPALVEGYYTTALALNYVRDKLASYKKARILCGGRGPAIYLIRKLMHSDAEIAVVHTTKEDSLAAKARLEKIEPNLKINWFMCPLPLQADYGHDSDFIFVTIHVKEITDEWVVDRVKDGGALFVTSDCKRPQGRGLLYERAGKKASCHVIHNLME